MKHEGGGGAQYPFVDVQAIVVTCDIDPLFKTKSILIRPLLWLTLFYFFLIEQPLLVSDEKFQIGHVHTDLDVVFLPYRYSIFSIKHASLTINPSYLTEEVFNV
jgi:hypothetical protein